MKITVKINVILENYDEGSEDNSVFDKILAINQKSSRCRNNFLTSKSLVAENNHRSYIFKCSTLFYVPYHVFFPKILTLPINFSNFLPLSPISFL